MSNAFAYQQGAQALSVHSVVHTIHSKVRAHFLPPDVHAPVPKEKQSKKLPPPLPNTLNVSLLVQDWTTLKGPKNVILQGHYYNSSGQIPFSNNKELGYKQMTKR